MPQETSNITVRMPADRQRQLDAIASQADRSRNWLINRAIETYLELYGDQAQHIEAALARLESEDAGATRNVHGEGKADGAALVAHWRRHGIIGSRPDITDSGAHARQLRKDAEIRHKRPLH